MLLGMRSFVVGGGGPPGPTGNGLVWGASNYLVWGAGSYLVWG
jgi:hypothetical protein